MSGVSYLKYTTDAKKNKKYQAMADSFIFYLSFACLDAILDVRSVSRHEKQRLFDSYGKIKNAKKNETNFERKLFQLFLG